MLVSLKLNLPKEVVDSYEMQGDLEKVIASRLIQCVDHTSGKPIYVDDETRRQFDKLFGRNFATARELFEAVERIMSIVVNNIKVPLQPTLIKRLRTRCFGMEFEDFLAQQTVKGLEEFAGMR